MQLPRRTSLAEQTADILRNAIRQGEWTERLPGEHTLSERLKVSRTTLRAALGMLRREGLLDISQGQRVKIVARPERTDGAADTKVVGVVAGLPSHELSSFSLFLIARLQDDLSDLGWRLEVHADPRVASPHPSHSLTRLVNSTQTDAWVLIGPSPACLQWFIHRRVPIICVTDTPETLDVPAVYVDSAAAVRHAVGLFLKRGYSRVVMLRDDRQFQGGPNLEKAFADAFPAGDPGTKVQSLVVRHAPGVAGIQRALDSFLSPPGPPAGMLVLSTKDISTTICHLANSGIRVPQQVGLISLSHLPYMDGLLPSIAHYSFNWKHFAKRLSTAVRVLVTVGELPQRQIGILPEFHEGGSITQVAP